MTARIEALYQPLRDALRDEQAIWSPQCPEPETLLDWIEQETAHPQAKTLLQHLSTCAYCRREYADMREAWTLAKPASALIANTSTPKGKSLDGFKYLPRKVATWTRELIAEGIAQPVKAVRESLKLIDSLTGPSSLAMARSVEAPNDLHPANTALRSTLPTLHWSAVEKAEEYVLIVAQQRDQNSRRILWKDSVGLATQVTLPEAAGVEPGGIYVWQVEAHRGKEEYLSAPVGFTILSASVREQVEMLESDVAHSALTLIGLYTAHGLYEEALEQADRLVRLDPDDETAVMIQTKLHQQMRR